MNTSNHFITRCLYLKDIINSYHPLSLFILQESDEDSDSDSESDSDDSDLDEDAIARRRELMRQRALYKAQAGNVQEEMMRKEDEKSEDESDSDEETEEEETDSEAEDGARLKPVFVR